MKVYLDNAATTPIDPQVISVIYSALQEYFGNPSSVHAFGRPVRSAIENARKKIAQLLNAQPGEIFFTSGGTEADNAILIQSALHLGIKNIITSPLEHHAVEHTVRYIEQKGWAQSHWLKTDEKGNVDLHHLEQLLISFPNALVSLMHANNEIGTMISLEEVGNLCKKYGALFHSDTVQTMGHYAFDVQKLPVDFLTAAAHKFHGPKGVGFMFIRKGIGLSPFIHGGAQERNMRGGTENVYGILGMEKALEISLSGLEEHKNHILELKQFMMNELKNSIPGVMFNGETSPDKSLYTVLNVRFPAGKLDNEMLLFYLDMEGVAASVGSACSSGSHKGSHVLHAIGVPENACSVRFSFSRFNTKEEIRFALEKIQHIMKKHLQDYAVKT